MSEIQRNAIPWEQKKEIGFFKAFFRTIKEALFSPSEFFRNADPGRSLWEPFTFFFILNLGTQLLGLLLLKLFVPSLGGNILLFTALLSVLVTPFLASFGMSAIIHVFVLLFKGQGGFRGSFVVINYGYSAMIASIIPLLGGLVAAIWYFIVVIKGLAQVHKYSRARAALSLLIPAVLFGALSIYNQMHSKKFRETLRESYEMSALASLQTINSAQALWRVNNPSFAPDLSTLANAEPPYIHKELGSGTLRGYSFSIAKADDRSFVVIANPINRREPAMRSFCVAEDGAIHYQDNSDYSKVTSVCAGALLEK